MAEQYVEGRHVEWQEALRSLIHFEGHDEARRVLKMLSEESMRQGGEPTELHSPHRNSIPVAQEPAYPGDLALESRLRAAIRWNSIAMVVRANQYDKSLGGHLASFMSSCTLYEVGFNHFFRTLSANHGGDLVYFQGHIAPGIYSRSFLEGRLNEFTLDRFRQEVGGGGLSSYPHPYLMPEYWQFSTVSMGLGPIQAIYQARLMRYLDHRGITPLGDRKVWAFLGDGECDEVETLGALPLASRERLGHLIFVVNCNLQRLDGPVRGNDRVMDELERIFRGSGWNVIKVVWGSEWDPLFAADHDGALQHCLDTTVDGEYQSFKAQGAAYTRTHLFGKSPTLSERTAALSDEAIAQLKRGGHDPKKFMPPISVRPRAIMADPPSFWPTPSRATAWALKTARPTWRRITSRRSPSMGAGHFVIDWPFQSRMLNSSKACRITGRLRTPRSATTSWREEPCWVGRCRRAAPHVARSRFRR